MIALYRSLLSSRPLFPLKHDISRQFAPGACHFYRRYQCISDESSKERIRELKACNTRLAEIAVSTNGAIFGSTNPAGRPGRNLGRLDPSPTSDSKTAVVAGRGLGGGLGTRLMGWNRGRSACLSAYDSSIAFLHPLEPPLGCLARSSTLRALLVQL